MTLLAAATLGDDLVHTPLLGQILKVATTIGAGLLTGIAIGAAAAFIVGTGGLGALVLGAVVGAVIGVAADAGARALGAKSLDDLLTKPIFDAIDKICPGVVKGKILTGSANVFINSEKAARAAGKPDPGFAAREAARAAAPPPSLWESIASAFMGIFTSPAADYGFTPVDLDKVLCSDHPPSPEQFMAQGSGSVFYNSQPAVRVTDQSTCEGKVSLNPGHARRNVSVGGPTVQVREISSEMPPWLASISRYAGFAIGICQALRGRGSLLSKVICFGTNMAAGMAADVVVRGSAGYLGGRMGHPVHVPTGAKVLDGEFDTDFVLDARLPIEWSRCYNSSNPRAGLFGRGWVVLYDLELRLDQPDPETPGSRHVLVDLQGRGIPLPELAPGRKFVAAQEGFTFAHTTGGHFMVQYDDGLVVDFGASDAAAPTTLRPWAVEDRNGNASFLRYDDDGRLAAIATSCGLSIALDYDVAHPGRVGAIRRSDVEAPLALAKYAYDADGNLCEVRNGADETLRRFAYDDGQRLCMQVLPQGLEVRYRWADVAPEGDPTAASPRVVGYATSAGEEVALHYRLSPTGSGSAETVDQLGRSHAWTWDDRKRVTTYRNPVGGVFRLEWDARERQLLGVTNPQGGTSRFAYDARGNVVAETDPLGQVSATAWHDALAVPIEEVSPGGAAWTWQYDAVGNRVHETAPGGLEQHWTHDEHGAVLVHVDARGGINRFRYDAHGRLLQATDCSERSTYYDYDALGQLVRETDAAGQVTAYAYDGQGRLQRAVLPDGMQQAWRWRSDGRPSAHSRAGAVTRYEWDVTGALAAVVDPVRSTTRWSYDSGGRLVTLTDGNGANTAFEYDAADRQTAEVGIDGLRTEYAYDACDQPIGVVRAAGTPDAIRLELERDALGRLVRKTTPETTTRYDHDAGGRVVRIERQVAPPVDRTSDRSAPSKPDLPLLDEIVFAYDEAGRMVEETTVVHQLQGVSPGGSGLPAWTALPKPRRRTLRHEHDPLGFTTRTALPGGQTIDYLYYGSGHLHQLSFDGEVISDLERDALHREVARSQGGLQRDLTLDPLGRVLRSAARQRGQHRTSSPLPMQASRLQDSEWQHIARPRPGDALQKGYAYAPDGELVARIDAFLGEQRFGYDKAGRIRQSRNVAPSSSAPGDLSEAANAPSIDGREPWEPSATSPQPRYPQLAEEFVWDAGSNALPAAIAPGLDGLAVPAAAAYATGRVENNRVLVWQDIRYRYDAHGRMVSKQSGRRRTVELQWNIEHQLVGSTSERPGVAPQRCRYHYDALGRRIGKTDGFATTWFVWDGLRMAQEERGGRCITTLYEEAQSYVPLARVEHGATERAISHEQVFYFHTDVNGAPEELTSSGGRVVWKARYRTWGNAVFEQWDASYEQDPRSAEPRAQNLRFQGQYFDIETGLHYNTFRYFDPDGGRFCVQDPIGLLGGSNFYAYAVNTAGWIDPLGLAGERPPNTYHSFDSFNVPESLRYSSDGVQFNRANQSFINKMSSDPAYRRDMMGRYPELGEWLKKPVMANSPPGLTWHHHEDVRNLRLVDRLDHANKHGIYHPTGKGGRDMWGGGKPGRTGKLNGATGCK